MSNIGRVTCEIKEEYCSFCGVSINDLDKDGIPFKEGMDENSVICYGCVDSFNENLEDFLNKDSDFEFSLEKTPLEIVKELDKHVIGQENAKRTIALAAYQHYKRINDEDQNLDKNNILLIGPTGSGKTLLVKTLSKILNVPFYIARANSITEAGYAGDDVEGILEGLLEKCDGNVAKAELGIIFIDEIDKIKKSDSGAIKDISGLGTQNSLLTVLEDDEITVYKRNEFKAPVTIKTKNILFISSGAFSGINEIINKRLNKTKVKIGIKADAIKVVEDQKINLAELTTEDLINFGMVPEFIGRFPVLSTLNGLTIKDLMRTIKEPENSILKQYEKTFLNEGVKLLVEDSAIEEIAKDALLKKTGARGLKANFSKIFEDALFDASSIKGKFNCILSKENYLKNNKAILVKVEKNRVIKNKQISQ